MGKKTKFVEPKECCKLLYEYEKEGDSYKVFYKEHKYGVYQEPSFDEWYNGSRPINKGSPVNEFHIWEQYASCFTSEQNNPHFKKIREFIDFLNSDLAKDKQFLILQIDVTKASVEELGKLVMSYISKRKSDIKNLNPKQRPFITKPLTKKEYNDLRRQLDVYRLSKEVKERNKSDAISESEKIDIIEKELSKKYKLYQNKSITNKLRYLSSDYNKALETINHVEECSFP